MTKVCWERMLPHEFAAALEKCPVCYLPMGTLERHGGHLAFGLDALKVHGLCVRAAEKYGGVVLPPLHWGTHDCNYKILFSLRGSISQMR